MKVTPWYKQYDRPKRRGYYEVRNSEVHIHWRHKLVGSDFRYWDGKIWRTSKNQEPSIMESHWSHQWRGLLTKRGK